MLPETQPTTCCFNPFLEYLVKTTQSMLKSLKLPLHVMVKLMEVTMLILKPNVKHSTSVLLMELVVLPNTASFVPMEPYSTRTTSSVTGGSTLTVPQLRISTASQSEYAAPVPPPPADYADYPAEVADYTYDASYDDAALAGYEETTLAAVESYLPPGDARRGRRVGGGSRRGGRRQGRRNQRRPSGRRSFRG